MLCNGEPTAIDHLGGKFGGVQGQASDIEIHAREILRMKSTLNDILVRHTGQPLERIAEDTERDRFLTPEQSQEYGLIDTFFFSNIGLV